MNKGFFSFSTTYLREDLGLEAATEHGHLEITDGRQQKYEQLRPWVKRVVENYMDRNSYNSLLKLKIIKGG